MADSVFSDEKNSRTTNIVHLIAKHSTFPPMADNDALRRECKDQLGAYLARTDYPHELSVLSEVKRPADACMAAGFFNLNEQPNPQDNCYTFSYYDDDASLRLCRPQPQRDAMEKAQCQKPLYQKLLQNFRDSVTEALGAIRIPAAVSGADAFRAGAAQHSGGTECYERPREKRGVGQARGSYVASYEQHAVSDAFLFQTFLARLHLKSDRAGEDKYALIRNLAAFYEYAIRRRAFWGFGQRGSDAKVVGFAATS